MKKANKALLTKLDLIGEILLQRISDEEKKPINLYIAKLSRDILHEEAENRGIAASALLDYLIQVVLPHIPKKLKAK